MPHVYFTMLPMGLDHKFIYKAVVMVEAARIGGAVEWDSVRKSKTKACGRSKTEKQNEKDYSYSRLLSL